ncbi:hypothetical protein V3478_32715, partial [Pseudomonas aeruginosa]|uniref:hypothetical protein n=1 Tax=Pseudomonas aeruginosa TaxID=287 RepID=UPI002F951F04
VIKVIEHSVHVDIVSREQGHFQAARTIFETTLPVSLGPKADEQEASCKVQLYQMLVRKEPWLDVS